MEIVGSMVFGEDDAVCEWVRQRVPTIISVERMRPFTALGIHRNGRLIAGVVYNRFLWPDIHVTCAATSKTWCTKQVLRTIVNYPFRQKKCQRITCITEAGNRPTRAFLEHFGFKEEGAHPFLFPDGETGVSFGLYRNSCRWFEEPHGQIDASTP